MKRGMILCYLILAAGGGAGVLAQSDAVPSLAEVARRTKAEQSRQGKSRVYTNDNLTQGDGGSSFAGPIASARTPATTTVSANTGQASRQLSSPSTPAQVAIVQNAQAPGASTTPKENSEQAPTAPAPATPKPPVAEKPPAAPSKISYTGGMLQIDVLDSTLGDVLAKVTTLTGVKFEIPPAASGERLAVVKLGPGPARQTLASLLGGANLDYLILAPSADPDGIQEVVLMAREEGDRG